MTDNKDVINEAEEANAENDTERASAEHSHHGSESRHSGHGSHSRHSSHRRRSSKRKKKDTPYNRVILDRKTIYKICGIVAIAVLILAVVLVINHFENHGDTVDYVGGQEVKFNGEFVIVQRPHTENIDLVSGVVKDFFVSGHEADLKEIIKQNSDVEAPYDVSVPVVLTPEIYNLPEDMALYGYLVEISMYEDFSTSDTYIFKYGEEIEIYNLRTACKYYYRVSLVSTPDVKDTYFKYVGSFTTSDTPRILSIDGVNNVRDIGGWRTSDGKRIRQGLLYRGTELDGIVQADYRITDKGIYTMTNILDIKYDMDLRGEHENPTGVEVWGSDISHKYYGVNMYKGIFTDEAKVKIKNVFSDLANPDNYPVYLHCTYGMDRTGTICYLLEALLGVSDDDLLMEYRLSSLHYTGMLTNDFETTRVAMSAYEGESTQEKVENYLLECGVTPEEIASIREIFLVDEEFYNAE